MQTPTDLNAVIEASDNKLIILDFWAEWCGPCQSLTPILEKLATEMAHQLSLIKINTDEEPDLAAQFDIKSLPTLIFVKDRKMVDQAIGLQTEGAIREIINKHATALSEDANDNSKEIANQLIFDGSFKKAADLLSEAIIQKPTDYDLRFLLIDAIAATGNTGLAEEQLAAVPEELKKGNDFQRAKTRIALMQQKWGDDDPAEVITSKLLKRIDENDLAALLDLAVSGNDNAKALLLSIFKLMGNSGPIVNKYRGQLMTYLN